MQKALLITAVLVWLATPALAALPFHDDFEAGNGNWTTWSPQTILDWDNNDIWHNHDPGVPGAGPGDASVRAHAYSGAAGQGYMQAYDFGQTSGPVSASVWIMEDHDNGDIDPTGGTIQLVGPGTHPSYGMEYLQLGIISYNSSASYSARTKYNDDHGLGFVNTGVARAKGSKHLEIDAASIAQGGLVQFFIDDALVGTSHRSGDLQYIYLGWGDKNYENFWYDGVVVTPEPAGALLLLLGAPVLLRRRKCC